ncbi:anti-phage dCTP deaminase [Xanthomonas prunicola]|uniref:Deoxycytidylate deaminase n=1 Tax=Xanthomonas prunicola TaxID=2053930 RepID=A0A2N3RLF2_9XANT|nr:anti-phage dCTP deaminase [Xanthomonas prunicola]PKV13288.1 deoxycytidylate deaminase [Xanthomonas prunicola]PKV17566.1 deoxycytidylate deaminase [Xanthomonas prunicola]PKV21462.1 deoxycytidylate deaminase [Xanthomonas prunicola]
MNSALTLVSSDASDDQKFDPKRSLKDILDGIASKELVLAFSGPIGAGVKEVIDLVDNELLGLGYSIERIKLSDLIRQAASKLAITPTEQESASAASRYRTLQDLGNRLRDSKGNDVLAQLSVRHISLDRAKKNKGQIKDLVPGRVVYLIDQLKNPSEVALLRAVYRENFYLLGTLCGSDQRKRNLQAEGLSVTDAESLMERDRKEGMSHGQNLEKTLQLADFFVRNSSSNTKAIKGPVDRFLRLVHGDLSVTPTIHEQGMYAAFSAGLGSACMSRQVGAAIIDREGKLIAMGCNDVPRGGGGLYRESLQPDDHRCIHLKGGNCFNDEKKNKVSAEIGVMILPDLEEFLKNSGVSGFESKSKELASIISRKIRGESRLKDLIEFSRAVHAEMDALVNLGRTGQGTSQDSVLYTTTYPCHNCARHIVAAGVRAVYFIEPYEKSLATELHSDAISHDVDQEVPLSEWLDPDRTKHRKVAFLHFEGVSPRRYMDLFFAETRKDAHGKGRKWVGRSASKKIPEYLEAYPALESRVVEHLDETGMGLDNGE